MDFSIIDDMFEEYKNNNLMNSREFFIQALKNYERYGNGYLIQVIKEYIKQQANNVPNHFVSDKDNVCFEHNLVRDYVTAFENLVTAVNFFLIDITKQDDFDDSGLTTNVRPHDFFNMNIDIIEKAVEEYADCYMEDFLKIKDLIIYVKKNKVLKNLYKDNSWYEIDFEELMYNIYDSIKDKSIFERDFLQSYRMDTFLFEKIKNNCSDVLGGSFDKFRPNLNSTKQIRANFGKLIFCRNLLMFFETGIMPSYDGFIDFSVDYYEHLNLIDDFKQLYSKNFDERSFREHQSNFICNPEVYSTNYQLEAKKRVKQGDKLIVGFIVSCCDAMKSVQNDYLIHIEIDDINNQLSNYEMQINIIPHGNLEDRLQLMRIDNWETKQTHKNIAKTLSTTTHVHLYNEFDLLRGKTNGGFDIAYNLEGTGVEFESALKTFLEILDLGRDISKSIYKFTTDCLANYVKLDVDVK